MIYKISGAWGNHEGSMLLLVLILCGYNLALVRNPLYPKGEQTSLTITAYLTQLLITAGFLAFLILTSNPFERIFPVPENGLGLNPLLQDVGLAIHPPILYLGYIGFSVVFSFAIAALIHGEAGAAWAKRVRVWALNSWGLLTFGIGLGSWWAYRELGWGGFWFWDPVENVSLMPWLAATGLYHSLLVLEKRGAFAVWSVLLAIITFCLSLIGIFLVRSGVVSSVHAFANDPARGVFILGFLGLIGITSFFLFGLRAGKLETAPNFSIVSRESLIMLNNIFFTTLSATVLLGTLYPIFLDMFSGTRVSVGAPYFNATFNYIAILMLIFTAFVPAIRWSDKGAITRREHLPTLIVGCIAGVITYIKGADFITIIALLVAAFLLAASLKSAIGFDKKIILRKLPMRAYAMILAHSGAAVLVIGIAITTAFGVEKEQVMEQGAKIDFAGYTATLEGGTLGMGKNYIFRRADFRIKEGEVEIAKLSPELRVYPVEGSSTMESAIYYTLFSNIYLAIGEIDKDGLKYATRVYYKPMVNLIWFGCLMMASGGLIAAWGRKKGV